MSDSALRRMIDMYSYLETPEKQQTNKDEEVLINEPVLVEDDHHEVEKSKDLETVDNELQLDVKEMELLGEEIEIEIEKNELSEVDNTESDDDDSYTSHYDDEEEEEEEDEEECDSKVEHKKCKKCNITFNSLEEYREHCSLLHSEARKRVPPYKCKDCDEVYMNIRQLWQHRKNAKHPKSRPKKIECHLCHQMFGSNHLNQHMRRHTKDKPYVCNVCGRGFSMSGNLRRHMMIHTGEKPHVCEVCGKGIHFLIFVIFTIKREQNDKFKFVQVAISAVSCTCLVS